MNRDHQEIVDEIFDLYEQHGSDDYIGEAISQIEHMCQCGQLAEKEGYDDEVILGAFFHDIGQICETAGKTEDMGGYGVQEHEKLGADFLRARGFSEKIASLVQNHVAAKRYLTATQPKYYSQLSEASKNTLNYQGGPMKQNEIEAFEKDPWFDLHIKLRYWDDEAKVVGVPLPDMNRLKQIALDHLNKHNN